MTGRSIFVELDAADLVQLERLAHATGQPRATLAGTLIHGALAADRRTDSSPTTTRST